jgi:hypothetical protein
VLGEGVEKISNIDPIPAFPPVTTTFFSDPSQGGIDRPITGNSTVQIPHHGYESDLGQPIVASHDSPHEFVE